MLCTRFDLYSRAALHSPIIDPADHSAFPDTSQTQDIVFRLYSAHNASLHCTPAPKMFPRNVSNICAGCSLRVQICSMNKYVLRSSRPNHSYRYDTVNLGIETNPTTLHEGPIYSGSRNITMDNATALCIGQGAGYSNPGSSPSNTPTDALGAAAKIRGFACFGYYDFVWNDFLMTTIAGVAKRGDGNRYLFWGSLVNYQVSFYRDGLCMSGCSQLANPGDDVL